MSLINNMLRGLEGRRHKAEDMHFDPVLGELTAVDYEELSRRRNTSAAALRLVLFLALLLAVYYLAGMFSRDTASRHAAEAAGMENAAASPAPSSPSAATGGGTADRPRQDTTVSGGGFALRLDTFMERPSEETPADDKAAGAVTVKEIRVARDEGGLKLELSLPAKTKYLMYTLKQPHRVVLELSNARYQGTLPDVSTMEGISGLHQRIEKDGTYKLTLESDREVRIEGSELDSAEEGYLLQVAMAYAADRTGGRAVAGAGKSAGDTASGTGTFSKSPVRRNAGGRDDGDSSSSSDADALLYEGRKLYREGEIRKGLEKIVQAVKLQPGHTRARTSLAMLLLEQDKEAAAREILAEGLSLRPDNSEWAKVLARILYKDGKLQEARTILEEAAPAINGNLDYHALYAAVLQALGDHTRAAIVYRNLLKYGGNNGAWWLGLAISLEAMSRETDAAVAYKNALNTPGIEPGSAEFIKNRLQSLKQRS